MATPTIAAERKSSIPLAEEQCRKVSGLLSRIKQSAQAFPALRFSGAQSSFHPFLLPPIRLRNSP